MVFAHPYILWLLVFAPGLAYLGYRVRGPRPSLVAVLRALSIIALVLAMSQPMLSSRSTSAVQVFVEDLDPAIAAAALETARHDMLGVFNPTIVAFASQAEVVGDPHTLVDPAALSDLRRRLSRPLWSDDATRGGANLGAALQLAGAQIPFHCHGSIRLYAEGWCDHGDPAAEAFRLAKRGIAVDVIPMDAVAGKLTPVTLRRVLVSSTAHVGETVDAEVQVESAITSAAFVQLKAGDASPVTVQTNLISGMNDIHIALPLHVPGLVSIQAAVWRTDGKDETVRGIEWAAIYVQSAPLVLVVQDAPEPGLPDALNAMLGDAAQLNSITPAQLDHRSLENVGAVILADLPANHLLPATQAELRRAVLSGTGLIVTGATRSFGPGGYDDSLLAPVLPVRMPQQMESIDPSTTLVLIIDTSGSMQGVKIDLAKEVARLALSHLRPQDKVGIVEFYGGKRWAAPIQSAANVSVIHRTLDRLTAGGGTLLYPAVEEASFALRSINTRSKHVMIISDGFVENAPFSALVRQMTEDGVAVSTIKVGAEDGPNMMPSIARWGGGRYYEVADEFALPDVSFKQPRDSILSPIVRTPSPLVVGDDPLIHSVTDSIWQPISSYVRTVAKPTADVLLKTIGGDPLLARWRYGPGFVSALPTQIGSTMTQKLNNQPQFASLVAALLRQADSGRGTPLQVRTDVRPAGIEVDVVSTDINPSLETYPLTVSLTDGHRHVPQVTQPVEAVAPGHWNVLLRGVTAGAYELTATVARTEATVHAGVAVPPPVSTLALSPNRQMLNEIASFASLAATRAAQPQTADLIFVGLQSSLATAAVVLLLLHVAARRWPPRVKVQTKENQR